LSFRATYRRIADRNQPHSKSVLDIGTATGHPLHSIIDTFKDAKVIGIDIDPNYIPACQKLFKKHENVTIKLMNFYDLDIEFPHMLFDTIIFGSSFMLMPDQSKAIELAKSINIY
jgi:ubiquinone/menaquinone biosynthesis C-methylase UbiE